MGENCNVNRRLLWGGMDGLYSFDSNIVCILYHLGIAYENGLDLNAFCDANNNEQQSNHDYDFMYVRKSQHQMTQSEIEEEQKRNLIKNKTIIGIAVILDIIFEPKALYQSFNKNGYVSRKWINTNNEIKASLRLKTIYPLTHLNEFVIDNFYLFPTDKDEEIKQFKQAKNESEQSMDYIAFEMNRDQRPCLKYDLMVIGNANLMMNEIEWNNEQNHYEPYGYLLQFRLEKFVLMMENNESRYQLMKTNDKKYKFIQISLTKQRHHNKIADDLSWQDLKWSNRGITIGNKLYEIQKVWLVNRTRIG